MITILHNPRCGKSRNAVDFLNKNAFDFCIRNYLKDPLNENELIDLLCKLDKKAIEIVRTQETIAKELNFDMNQSESYVIESLVKYPILLERPIVIMHDKAIICRTPEKLDLLRFE
jgi:arsenate reductase